MGRLVIGTLAALSALALTGCNWGHHSAGESKRLSKPGDEPTYSDYARSPDGKRVAIVVLGESDLKIGPADGGPAHIVYRGPITNVAWASPQVLVFGDGLEINTIDLRTRSTRAIASAASFTVSKDGRWVAWSKDLDPRAYAHLPATVGMVPISGGVCLVPPRPANKEDSSAFFKPGVKRLFFTRTPVGRTGNGGVISVPFSKLRPGLPSTCH